MAAPTIPEAIKALEDEIGLPSGFFERIAAEDDWSFVIKLHALIEHCVTSLIVRRTKSIGLERVTRYLRFNDLKTGKLAIARDLGLLAQEYVDFIRVVCEIRNDFVHDVNFLSVSLSEYIESSSNRVDLAKKICRLMNAEAHLNDGVLRAADLLAQHPKIALQVAAMDLLADIHLGHERVHSAMVREQLEVFALLRGRWQL